MGYVGIMGIYWGSIGMIEKKMETTIMGCIGIIAYSSSFIFADEPA